ncbi:hypothetical protein K3495_g15561 [Podosphaera aphanis]|nr:hypothetical protein K3495_g15561 [Podosphaera aphanis]
MDRAEYDDSLLNWKPGQKPLRSGLPQIRNVRDPLVRQYLVEIQLALCDDGSPYRYWPHRARHLFVHDFQEVQDFIRKHRPTWPMVIELVMQNLWQTGEARTPMHAFQLFRAGPNNDESRAQFLRRFYAAYGTLPPIEQCSDESDSLISWVLQHHTPIEWERLCARGLAYPLHSAIGNAWKIADQVQKEFASNQRFSGDIQAIPRMDNDILHVADRQAVFNNLGSSYVRISDNPINSVNAATNVCYKCKKSGHWATNCRSAPNTNKEFVKPSLKTPPSNSLISGTFQGKISQPVADNNKNFKTRGVNRSHGRGNSVKQFQTHRVNAAGEDELNEEDDVLNNQDEPYQLTGSFNPDDDYVSSPELENPKIDENYCTNTIFASQPDDEKTLFE